MIRRYLGLLALQAAGRWLARLLRLAVVLAVAAAAAPVSLVAAGSVLLAWRQGWPPARLYRAALWCLPMVAAWLAAIAARTGNWLPVAAAPYQAWLAMWHEAAAGRLALAAVTAAPPAIPLGLAAGGLAWARRIFAMETGTGGRSPASPAAFEQRQWQHAQRAARARIAAPGAVPLLTRDGSIAAGAVIRAAGHPVATVAAIPYQRLRSHQVVIGTTGTGKTTLLLRLWAGFLARGLELHAAGAGGRPLLVVLDCKGGPDSRRVADRARRVLRGAGARATMIWPDEAALSLWALPPQQLITTLADMVEQGTGAAAYYADVLEAIVAMAVGAPGGPPGSAAEFLARLDLDWLTAAYAGDPAGEAARLLRPAAAHVTDVALRYRTLLRRLGGGLDGPGGFGDADAWYCILEGTAEPAVAEAQARALADMLASYAVGGGGRDILLAVDEFSAVSRRLPIWQLYERARSLGLAVQVSAQSWQGLAATEDERYRVAAAAEGGIWLLRTPNPEPVTGLAGSRRRVDTSRRVLGVPRWGHRGSSRVRPEPVADPDRIRVLGTGQAGYLYRGGVTYVQVKRLVAGPAAIRADPVPARAAAGVPAAAAAGVPAGAAAGAGPAAPATLAADPAAGGRELPDAGPLLDEAFGTGPPGAGPAAPGGTSRAERETGRRRD